MSNFARSATRRKNSTITRPFRASVLQRAAVPSACQCKECAKSNGLLQRAAVKEYMPTEVPPIVYTALRSPGRPLDLNTREFMEKRFEHDFSAVRVHTDPLAIASAQAVNARAYTVGSHIVFGNGEYRPTSLPGAELLAHELTHTLQQRLHTNSEARLSIGDTPMAEDEANHAMQTITSANEVIEPTCTVPAGRIQRFPLRRPAEPDKGSCWIGSGLSPMAVGRLAHAAIQSDLALQGIDNEATIPRKLDDMRGTRADLVGVWTEQEARVRGLPFKANPETPYVVAEIGEIKPYSYSVGGPNYGRAIAEIDGYLSEWRRIFPKIPAIPMRSVTQGFVPFVAGGRADFLNYFRVADGLIIYSCIGEAEPSAERSFAADKVRQSSKDKDLAHTDPFEKQRAGSNEAEVPGQIHIPEIELPLGARAAILLFILEARLLKSQVEMARAAARFVAEHARECALLVGLSGAALMALLPPGWITLALATLLVAAAKENRNPDRATSFT